MDEFVQGDIALDIKKVPGIGPKAAEALKGEGIDNTYKLISKYLEMTSTVEAETTDGEGLIVDVFTTNNHLWHFLASIGVNSHRSAIVQAINKKVANWDNNFIDNTPYHES
jgi:hypothetical protein